MTETTAETPEGHRLARAGEAMLSRGLFRARAAILWERLWPALASMATAAGLFLALSWLGLWLWLPPIGRAIGVGLFFILAVAATLPLLKVRWPSRERRACGGSTVSACCRTGRPPPLPTSMAPEAGDQFAVALWRAHLERALRAASALKSGIPSPQACRPAIRSRCAPWCWCLLRRPSLPPAASAPSASRRRSTGTAW